MLAPGDSCPVDVYFYPSDVGERDANLKIVGSNDASSGGVSLSLEGGGSVGYYEVDTHGNVFTSGDALSYGNASSTRLNAPVVGIASAGNDLGYWLVASDGGIFTYGDAQFYGSTGSIHLNKPIVGMAATPDAKGYWFVASDGGIVLMRCPIYGSTGSIHLNQPIVGMTPTADGGGYWLVASDGGIFAYGDAQFYRSTGSIHLNQPIVGMTATRMGAVIGSTPQMEASSTTEMPSSMAPEVGKTGPLPLSAWWRCQMAVGTGLPPQTVSLACTGVPPPLPATTLALEDQAASLA